MQPARTDSQPVVSGVPGPPKIPHLRRPSVAMTRSVWMDTDPAYGEAFRDTDDVFALIQALRAPELDVRGISIVHGNPRCFDRSVIRTRRLIAEHGPRPVSVYPGARGGEDLGRRTEAVEALENALSAHPLTILAIGPLTTVATLLQGRPDLHPRVREIVAVAGRRPGHTFRPGRGPRLRRALFTLPDLNLESDAEAFRRVLRTEVPITLVPYEAGRTVGFGAESLHILESAGSMPPWLLRRARSWLRLWTHVIGFDAFHPFDCLAVGHLTTPELMHYEHDRRARVERRADDRPLRWGTKPYLFVDDGPGRPVTYCTGASPAFKADLLARFSKSTATL